MWRDPIVEEVRRWRDEYAAQFDCDLTAIIRDLRKRQKRSGRKYVRLPPRCIKKAAGQKDQPAA